MNEDPNEAMSGSTYEDKMVEDNGTDQLAQGHGEPPADTAGVTGGADADPDPNPAFHGAGMDVDPNGGEPVKAFDPESPATPQ